MDILQALKFARQTNLMGFPPYWKPSKIERVQQQRLRSLLKRAVAQSPFYQKQFSGIDIANCKLSDLPTLRKDQVRDNFDELVTDRRLKRSDLEQFVSDEANLGTWYLDKYSVSHTSGSQGPPLLIVQDKECLQSLFAVMGARASSVRRPGILEGLRRLRDPKRVAVVTFRRGFYPSSASLDFMQQIVGPFVRVERFSSMQPDLIEKLNQYQPHVLVSYAGVLEALSLQGDALQLKSLQHISNSSEQLTWRARKRIEETFKVPIFDHYGTGECLQMADGCSAGKVHINSDWAIVEVVDQDNRPVPNGKLGSRILVTNLSNHTQPFIRYEVDDRVALSRQSRCECGSYLPFFDRIEGRASEMVWLEIDGTPQFYSGVLFHTAADTLQSIREWRVIQKSKNELTIHLQLLDSEHQENLISAELQKKLREYGLPASVKLHCEVVSGLNPDPLTGKMRRIVPLSWRESQPA